MPEQKMKAPIGDGGLETVAGQAITSAPSIPEFGAPILPANVPAPSNLFCPVLGRRMLFAPPYLSLTDQAKAVAWDYYFAGRNDGAAEAYTRGYLQGRYDEAEELAAIQRQAAAIAHDVRPTYWDLCERRGEPKRAAAALARAKERGYFV